MSSPQLFRVEKTLPMTVANTGFMLDRLGQDCAPLQFLRELTQNSIEAIQETSDQAGEVVWDVDWNQYALTGIYKLCVIDTGVGMTGPEMVEYINRLSSSAHVQSHEGNFGVGAKIAAATRNHEGLIYLSWKSGIGSMVHLWRDPTSGEYGLRQFERPDGTFDHWGIVEDAVKPSQIGEHGTMVVLLGNTVEENTMIPPESAPAPSVWVSRYLNTRYFRFPEGVVLRAREGWVHPREDKDRNLMRTVRGQGWYLDQHAQSSGFVEVTGAKVHWWVLKDEGALTQQSGTFASSGHTAALYQNELYELGTGRAGVARLQHFGVIFGYQRVVLYVEPNAGEDVTSNTSRTVLLWRNEPLPWAEWAAEFRERMPEEIKTLMEDVTAGSVSPDHRQAIRDRLKQIRDLFRVSRYRPAPKGDVAIDPDSLTSGGTSAPSDAERTGTSRGGGAGGRAGNVYGLFLADTGEVGEEVNADLDPKVDWVTVAQGTRLPQDMEDRAAKYLPEQNRLLINGDFRLFNDMTDRWAVHYDVPGARDAVQEVVREWFEQTLIETVLGAHALRGSRLWTMEDIAKLWTEEALTASVLPRYHIDLAVKRGVGSKLGRSKAS